MEIFNSIWTALSTPNEGLLNILLILISKLSINWTLTLLSIILNILQRRIPINKAKENTNTPIRISYIGNNFLLNSILIGKATLQSHS